MAEISWVVMEGIKSMLGRIKENNHIYKPSDFQRSGGMEKSEWTEEFNEEHIWGSNDIQTSKQVGFKENGFISVAVGRSMGKGVNDDNSRRSVKIHRKESNNEENNKRRMRYQSSTPVNIPEWSQMSWEEKNNQNWWSTIPGLVDDDSSDDDGGGDGERQMIPPHELIARQRDRSGVTSSSAYEGVGRTLKARGGVTSSSAYEGVGRTLKARDAVWTITGFIE